MALELYVSTDKYEARIAMLETQLAMLKNLAQEYENLQAQVPTFMGESDAVGQMRSLVSTNVQRVNKAIEATQAAINTLNANVATMSNAGQNVTTIIEEGINLANTFS